MTLDDWMTANGWENAALAKKAGIQALYVWRHRTGAAMPKPETVDFTNGAVRWRDLWDVYKARNKAEAECA